MIGIAGLWYIRAHPMPDSILGKPGRQFSPAEYETPSGTDACKFCRQPVGERYYRIKSAMACGACVAKALGVLALIGLASPFLELTENTLSGIIGLVILAVGIQIAWKMTAGKQLDIIPRSQELGHGGVSSRMRMSVGYLDLEIERHSFIIHDLETSGLFYVISDVVALNQGAIWQVFASGSNQQSLL